MEVAVDALRSVGEVRSVGMYGIAGMYSQSALAHSLAPAAHPQTPHCISCTAAVQAAVQAAPALQLQCSNLDFCVFRARRMWGSDGVLRWLSGTSCLAVRTLGSFIDHHFQRPAGELEIG